MKLLPRIPIVILNYNGYAETKECIKSVLKTKYDRFHIYVVDNGSQQNESELLKNDFKDKRITFIRNKKNFGYAEGNNRLFRKIRTPYVVLLNNDTKVTPFWLTPLVKTVELDNKIAACQPKILSLTKKEYFDYAGAAGGYLDGLGYPYARGRIGFHMEKDEGQYDDQVDIFWASGACILFRTDALKKVGLFAKDFFFYHEETDLCWRLKDNGYRIVSVPEAKVYHKGAASSSKDMPKRIFYVHRNNLLLLSRNLSLKRLVFILPARIILDFASIVFYILTNKPEYFLSVIKAHISFFQMLPEILKHRKKITFKAEKEMKPFSIFWLYFTRNVRRYSEIAGNQSITGLTKYTKLVDTAVADKRRLRYRVLVLAIPLAMLLCMLFIIRVPFFKLPLTRDEGAYAYIGYHWLRGDLIPYRDVFDHKTPLSYIIYGLSSLFAPHNLLTGIRVSSFIYLFLLVGVFFVFAKKISSSFNAFISSIIFILAVSSSAVEGLGFNTEVISLLPVLLAYFLTYCFSQKNVKNFSWFWVGLFLGLAVLIKQTAAISLFGIYPILWILSRQNGIKRSEFIKQAGIMTIGAILPIIITYFYLSLNNSLGPGIEDTILYNIKYVREGLTSSNISVRSGVLNDKILAYLRWFLLAPKIVDVLGIFTIVGIIYSFRRNIFLGILLTIFTITSFLGAKLGGSREAEHYYLSMIPGLCLGIVPLLMAKGLYRKVVILGVIIIFLGTGWIHDVRSGNDGIQYQLYGTQAAIFKEAEPLGSYVHHNVNPSSLFVWANEPEVYFFSTVKAYDKNINFYGFYFLPDTEIEWWKRIQKKSPQVIVAYNNHDEPMYSLLQKFLQLHSNYQKVSVPFTSYVIYEAKR